MHQILHANMKRLVTVGVLLCGFCSAAESATISWSGQDPNGFSLLPGVPLPIGNLVRVGTFTNTDLDIKAHMNDTSYLNAHFIDFGDAHIGDGVPIAGFFAASSQADTGVTGLNIAGAQTYMWVLSSTDNSTVANSLAHANAEGIFYLTKGAAGQNAQWAMPAQGNVPETHTIDITDLTIASGTAVNLAPSQAVLVVGTFGLPVSNAAGKPDFDLALIPEPASVSMFCAAGIMFLARRRKACGLA